MSSGSPRMKLAVYSDAPLAGGAEESLGNLLAELPEEIDVTVVGVSAEVVGAIAARRPDSKTEVLSPVRNKRDLRAVVEHLRLVRRLRPDILHANLWTPWAGQYAVLAGILVPGVKVVIVEQLPLDTTSRAQRVLKRITSRRVHAHVAVGERAARRIEGIVGLDRGSVRTIYNGVPDLHVDPAVRPASGPLIGSLGRMTDQKGYDVLVRGLRELPGVTAVVVGDGPQRSEIEALASAVGVRDRFKVLGWRADARRYLPVLDVFVLPSRFEGFPLSIVEAMLAGTPVVATDVGSISEAIVHGETGLLVSPDDPDALARAVQALLDDPPRRRALAEAARHRASERFTARVMAAGYRQLYEEILADVD
jgi:glycosyltransferase involved in cell wall biosynthesis